MHDKHTFQKFNFLICIFSFNSESERNYVETVRCQVSKINLSKVFRLFIFLTGGNILSLDYLKLKSKFSYNIKRGTIFFQNFITNHIIT